MTPQDYLGPDQFQREKRRLFAREWLPICALAQLAESGAYVNHSLGGWPIFVIAGLDGRVRGFRNTCRHQGMPVLDKPAGRCSELRCRFHGWTYDLAGKFVSAPAPVAPYEPGSERTHLEEVALAVAAGLVYVRLEPAAPPSSVPEIDGSSLAAAHTIDVAANWKLCVETALADPACRLIWPIALLRTTSDGAILRQIVPRSFARTRLIDYLFNRSGSETDQAAIELRAAAERARAVAEAAQARLAGGSEEPTSSAVAAFRERLAAACAE
jgi:nitrite reductase/ring-hydroxylating ferredoxin subunit